MNLLKTLVLLSGLVLMTNEAHGQKSNPKPGNIYAIAPASLTKMSLCIEGAERNGADLILTKTNKPTPWELRKAEGEWFYLVVEASYLAIDVKVGQPQPGKNLQLTDLKENSTKFKLQLNKKAGIAAQQYQLIPQGYKDLAIAFKKVGANKFAIGLQKSNSSECNWNFKYLRKGPAQLISPTASAAARFPQVAGKYIVWINGICHYIFNLHQNGSTVFGDIFQSRYRIETFEGIIDPHTKKVNGKINGTRNTELRFNDWLNKFEWQSSTDKIYIAERGNFNDIYDPSRHPVLISEKFRSKNFQPLQELIVKLDAIKAIEANDANGVANKDLEIYGTVRFIPFALNQKSYIPIGQFLEYQNYYSFIKEYKPSHEELVSEWQHLYNQKRNFFTRLDEGESFRPIGPGKQIYLLKQENGIDYPFFFEINLKEQDEDPLFGDVTRRDDLLINKTVSFTLSEVERNGGRLQKVVRSSGVPGEVIELQFSVQLTTYPLD